MAIGHNGRIAWGLTIVGTDQSDVYVEEVNPENPNEVRYEGAWEPLRIEVDTIRIRGGDTEVVEARVGARPDEDLIDGRSRDVAEIANRVR